MKSFLLLVLFVSSAYASASETLICAGGNIEVTYKEGTWPFSSDKATFKDKSRKLDLSSDFSVLANTYGIENNNWVSDDIVVFQLGGTKNGQTTYDPYLLLLSSYDMRSVRSNDKVTIGFSSSIPEKIKEYRCTVK